MEQPKLPLHLVNLIIISETWTVTVQAQKSKYINYRSYHALVWVRIRETISITYYVLINLIFPTKVLRSNHRWRQNIKYWSFHWVQNWRHWDINRATVTEVDWVTTEYLRYSCIASFILVREKVDQPLLRFKYKLKRILVDVNFPCKTSE